MRKFTYYKYNKVRSYNGMFNFIVGARGLGKTFGAIEMCIRDGIKKGDQFIYLRRYKGELTDAKAGFFDAVEGKFPEFDFRVSGEFGQFAPKGTANAKKRQWFTIAIFVALSTTQFKKSKNYPKVKAIIFDEFIIEKGAIQYLPNEAVTFINYYSTVDRYQDKTKVYFLANSVTIMNPYFLYYDIMPEDGIEIITRKDNYVIAHFPKSAEYKSEVEQTRFGQFIKDTEYADYAVGNEFGDNTDAMLDIKDPKARPMFTLQTEKGTFGIWYNFSTNYYYIVNKLPKDVPSFTMISFKMTNDKRLMTFSDRPLANLRTSFRQGRMSFDKPATRNTFAEIFKR